MKKILAGLFAGLILTTGAQALAYDCEDGACELPQRESKAYCYDNGGAYCYGEGAQVERSDHTYTRGCCRR